MSASLIKAHGGSKTIVAAKGEAVYQSGLVQDTKVGMQSDIHMRGVDRLIAQTTGTPKEKPIMSGVLTNTTGARRDVPELHKLPKGSEGKTDSKLAVGGVYAGKKSGYGKAK